MAALGCTAMSREACSRLGNRNRLNPVPGFFPLFPKSSPLPRTRELQTSAAGLSHVALQRRHRVAKLMLFGLEIDDAADLVHKRGVADALAYPRP